MIARRLPHHLLAVRDRILELEEVVATYGAALAGYTGADRHACLAKLAAAGVRLECEISVAAIYTAALADIRLAEVLALNETENAKTKETNVKLCDCQWEVVAIVDGVEVAQQGPHKCRGGSGGDSLVADNIAIGRTARDAMMPAPVVDLGGVVWRFGARALGGFLRPLGKAHPRAVRRQHGQAAAS